MIKYITNLQIMASIFTKIINREIPADIVFENDNFIVIKDIYPEKKTHLLIIPKKEIVSINDLNEWDKYLMWEMIMLASKVAKDVWVDSSYKVRINAWDLQEVMHIHMHLLSDL